MAGKDYVLRVIGDIADYQKKIAGITGATDQAAFKAAMALEKRLSDAEKKAAKDAEKAAKQGAEAWSGAAKKLAGTGELSEKLAGGVGLISPAAASAVSALGKVGKAASVLLSPVGLVAAGIGALGLAGVAAAAGLVKAVFASDEALKRLEGFKNIGSDFYPKVSPETLASINAVNASVDALSSIWDKAIVTLGGAVAPALEKVADVLVGVALAAANAVEGSRWLGKGFAVVAGLAGGMLGPALVAALAPTRALADAFLALADLTGAKVPDGVRAAVGTLDRLTDAAVRFTTGDLTGTLGDLDAVFGDLAKSGASFIRTQERATRAAAAHKAALEEISFDWVIARQAAVNDGLAKGAELEKDAAARTLATADAARSSATARIQAAAQLAAIDARASGSAAAYQKAYALGEWAKVQAAEDAITAIEAARARDLAAADKAGAEALAKAHINAEAQAAITRQLEADRAAIISQSDQQIADTRAAASESSAQQQAELLAQHQAAVITSSQAVMGALQDAFSSAATAIGATNKDAAMKAWKISQALALIQASMAAVQAGASTAASLAFLGPEIAIPAGLLMAGAMEAAFVGTIAGQSPPSFAMGGVASGGQAGGLDHKVMLVSEREANTGVLNGRGVNSAGGPRGVARLNRGEANGGTVAIVQSYGTRLGSRALKDQVRGPSPLSDALSALNQASAKRRWQHG